MNINQPIGFGDRVRIACTPETEAAGVGGRIGQVIGETTPSITSPDVIGELNEDFAICVDLADVEGGLWFAEHLLERVDHGAGTAVTLDGVQGKLVRTEDGEWKAIDCEARDESLFARLFGAFKRRPR